MTRAERAVATCVHRWRIDTPAGPTVGACCRLCGVERTYRTVAGEPDPAMRWRSPVEGVAIAPPPRHKPPQRKGEGLGPLEEPARARCERCGMVTRAGAPMASHLRKHEREGE